MLIEPGYLIAYVLSVLPLCSVVSSFLDAGIVCVAPSYLVDWLAHPWQGLEQHYLFGSKPQEGGELPQLENARNQDGQGQQQSMSF